MPDPITRQETYLNAIAQNTGGGSAGSVPEPITREEQFLNQIVTNTAGGGGGGGSSLPAVTSDDNGDVLTVVEGQWAKAAPSGGVLVVNTSTTHTGYVMDQTFGTIFAAMTSGRLVIVHDIYEDNVAGVYTIGYISNIDKEIVLGGGGGSYYAESDDDYPVQD